MINQIDLRYFKCFEHLKLPIANLTLLTGSNASGKSSVLQSLVLLHQTMQEHEWSVRLLLNGKTLALGTVADVVDKLHGRRSFSLAIHTDDQSCRWTFSGERAEMSFGIDEIDINGEIARSPEKLQYLLPPSDNLAGSFSNNILKLTYITAERIGPREYYPLEDKHSPNVVGPAGENAISLLYSGGDEQVLPGLEIKDIPPTRLRQVEGRMDLFFPGCRLLVEKLPRVNAITLGIRTSDNTDFHRPIHVGFGLTQILPIVIAALSAGKGDVLLIENPEVHLHPAGQVLMGQFLAEVAGAGVQILIETHSDHVLNGIRRAVRTKAIIADNVAIHFFNSRLSNHEQVISPIIDSSGNISDWPEGFFDQFDKDMNHFAGWGD